MTDKPTNFITRHVATLRELAASMAGTASGLAEILGKSASIIEQVMDGNATLRVEHERQLTELRASVHALEAQVTATHQRVAELACATRAVDPTWQNLPCAPTDLNALIELMPSGWVEIEWSAEASTFVVVNAWGVTPAALDDYEWQDFHPDLGPGIDRDRDYGDEHFSAWPDGRRCFAEYVDDSEEQDAGFTLLAINDVLVYRDPEGAPEPATFFMCKACDANLGAAKPEPHDHCPICHKDGTLLLMREDGVRVP